jgi:hypothetical protein
VEIQGDPWEILRDSGEIQGNLGEIQRDLWEVRGYREGLWRCRDISR